MFNLLHSFMCRNGKYQTMSIMLLARVKNRFCTQGKVTSSSLQYDSSVPDWDRACVYTFTSDVTKGRLAWQRRQGCRSSRPASARYQPLVGIGIQFPLRNQRDRIGTCDWSGGDRPRLVVDRVCLGRFSAYGRVCSYVYDRISPTC